ncbi:hypothetical protein KC19_2G235200 [Ceratodon purpureus]|uniref:ZZ-type domain-containing protein n=1 Tax=Ceratodon purpureus TaxID=3225 RepID=A0A8T0J0B3_CERPU|nr:hypothetical protein KC19_2G235200 [Ceratodon purpureus]
MGKVKEKFTHGEPIKLCDSVFRFHQPEGPAQLEVVFVHGLVADNIGDAYWKTWLARDGTPNNVWPMTWLPAEFPFAQVYALKYDASIKQTATDGRMDLFLVGENLVQEMVDIGEIGQNGVPVVFVCHGFGGLVAKQIVVSAKNRPSQDRKAQNLLQNIRGFIFYSTPHRGSVLAKYLHNAKSGGKGPLLANMEVLNTETSRLSEAFEKAKHPSWYFKSAAETHATSQVSNNVFALVSSCLMFHFRQHKQVVEEASSRYEDGNYHALSENHFDIVRPKAKNDSSYLLLTESLKEVVRRFEDSLTVTVREESLVPESFVRLKEQEEAISRMLQEASIVGVVGMGGIGKTTLAKAVYQSICKDFDRSSYLDDVKSKASLDEVLVTLLQDFGITDRKTGSIVQHSALKDSRNVLLEDLKKYVHQHKVLVVVDDVGTEEILDRLLKDMGFLTGNKESRLIVTCRNWQVLKKYVPRIQRHDVEYMSSIEDIELFQYHAFQGARTVEQMRQILYDFLSKDSSDYLMDEFEIVCGDVVRACCGLPLSLEVMGRLLGSYLSKIDLSSKQCLDCWKGALEKLKNAEPLEGGYDNDKLWKVLKISYDALHENEKNMFLDIACFFSDTVQYSEQTLIWIWGGKESKLNELRNLKDRCLVKINREDGVVTMHDQLRDMGRGVVRGQGRQKVKKMSRVWDCKDVGELLQSNEIKSKQIEGLSLYGLSCNDGSISLNDGMEGESSKTSKERKPKFILNCPKLRLLDLHKGDRNVIEAINIEGRSGVQWLCLRNLFWANCEVPTFLQQCKELCVLDMSGWYDLMELPDTIGELSNLLELNLNCCSWLYRLPDTIGDLVKLSKLDLSGCGSLIWLPESIGKLSNLLELILDGCWRLTRLPDSIGDLVKLSKLDLRGCENLTCLLESIGKLSNLLELNFDGCWGLTRLPDSIGDLVKLSKLDFSNCWKFTCLPESIGKLSNLLVLNLWGCKGLIRLPDTLGNLTQVQKLEVQFCKNLVELPQSTGLLSQLSRLDMSDCHKWEWMKASQISLLHKLKQHGCSEILLPDGRPYHGKYSTQYCSSGAATCDGCCMMPISTKCWHCDICPRFDLCESCYERRHELDQLRRQSEHVEDHPMTAITVL